MIPEISIVIGTVDRPAHLNRFVESVLKYTDIPFELIIVDSGDNEWDGDFEQNELRTLKKIRDYPKAGYRQAYNKGFAAATGRYVAFLNDDVEVMQSWAIEAVRFMDANKWVGMGAIYFSEQGPHGPFQIREWLQLPYANFGVISKQFGDRLGWFDDYIYTYGADNSLSFKVFLAGKSIAGIPYCKVLHNPIVDPNKQFNMSRQPKDAANILLKYRHRLPEMYQVYRSFPPARMFT